MSGDYEDVNGASYSVLMDAKISKKEPTLRHTLPRRVYKWVDDDTVTSCYNCNKTFSFLTRRHHCRFCGRIFCYDCVNYQTFIPDDLLSDDSKKGTWNQYVSGMVFSTDPKKQKVCKGCYDLVNFITSVKKIIDVFILLELDLKTLRKISQTCRAWHNASNYILSVFREIQYKLPIDGSNNGDPKDINNVKNITYSNLEKQLLWTNINYIGGHSKYVVSLLKSCQTNDEYNRALALLHGKKKISCWSMMCTRNCSQKLTSFDVMSLLFHSFNEIGNNDHFRKGILDFLICSDREFKCYLPLLVYYLRYDNGVLEDFLINRCVNNYNLFNSLYWELMLYPPEENQEEGYIKLRNRLKELSKNKSYEDNCIKILEGSSLIRTLDNISKQICEEKKKYEEIKDSFKFKSHLQYPLNNNVKVKNINIDKIKIKNSATMPLLIPLETNNSQTLKVLYKKEDVRKDQILMNMITLIDIIVKREEGIDLGLTIYNILPTSKNTGVIEIVDNSDTIYYIQQKLKSSILNYILEENDNQKVGIVRESFIKSTAAYCVITYLFGVGDRHLDNIMVNKDGKLFHIDFGYILGHDPVKRNPGIRITPEIIEAIGGLSSQNYLKFTELCSKIYNCLRRNIDIFIIMLLNLPKLSDLKKSEVEIRDLLLQRFIPGENIIEAQLHLVNQLEKQNYLDKIKDWCHYHSKEKTVSSAMNRLTQAMSTLVQSPANSDETQLSD